MRELLGTTSRVETAYFLAAQAANADANLFRCYIGAIAEHPSGHARPNDIEQSLGGVRVRA